MKLLTKQLEQRFAQVGAQDVENPLVIARFFNPAGGQTWYATEYNAQYQVFFGYVSLFNDYNNELGSFSLEELESIQGKFGLGIERDLYYQEQTLDEIKKKDGTV